jgi:uncharacterized membrane protein
VLLSKQEMTMLTHAAEQTASEVLTDEQLELATAGFFSELIAGAEKGYSTGKSVGGTAGGVVGGAVGAVVGALGSLF